MLATIQTMAAAGNVSYSIPHAVTRMDERGVTARDVVNALITATSATWQTDHGSWAVRGGVDTDGEDLGVYVEVNRFTVHVRTVF